MKNYIAIIILFLGTAFQASGQDKFTGEWTTGDKSVVVQIYRQDADYYAKIVAGTNPESVNKIVLVQMEKKSQTQLFGGTYYDTEAKAEYEAKLKLIDDNTIRIKVLEGLFNKIIIWHRRESELSIQDSEYTAVLH